ncbi:hypothetical protein BJ170DRAFT_592903 [Xylariales sp. AK1849]|nr:hypothetical protein BJ170DRAFT_592903 [Xylariales sp. AK1849]
MPMNGNDTNGGSLCGVSDANCPSEDWSQSYADYLVQYIHCYADAGLNITHLGFLHEPDFTTNYTSMRSSGTQAAEFIRILYSTLPKLTLSHIGINCYGIEDWSSQVGMLEELSSGAVTSCPSQHTRTPAPRFPMDTKHTVWLTEPAELNGTRTAAWYSNGSAGLQGGKRNLKLNRMDGNNVIHFKRLWAFGPRSRSVKPSAIMVGVSGAQSGVEISAFRNTDESVAVHPISTGSLATGMTVKVVRGVAMLRVMSRTMSLMNRMT